MYIQRSPRKSLDVHESPLQNFTSSLKRFGRNFRSNVSTLSQLFFFYQFIKCVPCCILLSTKFFIKLLLHVGTLDLSATSENIYEMADRIKSKFGSADDYKCQNVNVPIRSRFFLPETRSVTEKKKQPGVASREIFLKFAQRSMHGKELENSFASTPKRIRVYPDTSEHSPLSLERLLSSYDISALACPTRDPRPSG